MNPSSLSRGGIFSTYGISLWSSCENSQNNARYLTPNNGYVYGSLKGYNFAIRRVRAYSTYGEVLWSSCESSQNYARGLYTHDGYVSGYINKGNYYTTRRVRA